MAAGGWKGSMVEVILEQSFGERCRGKDRAVWMQNISQGRVLRMNMACSMQVSKAGANFNRRFEARLPKATIAIPKSLDFICM